MFFSDKKDLITKLVEIANKRDYSVYKVSDSLELNENESIEYYELREFARQRIILRKSYKIHLILYLAVNCLIFAINWQEQEDPVKNFYKFWAFIPLLIWGFLLWVHFAFMATSSIAILMGKTLPEKIFRIIAFISVYLFIMAPVINYYVNQYVDESRMFWQYVDLFLFIGIAMYWWGIREIDDEEKLNKLVNTEIEKIKFEYKEHEEHQEIKEFNNNLE